LADNLTLVESCGHGAELAELVDAPLDGVAFLVELGIEVGRAAAGRSALEPVGLLVLFDWNDRPDAVLTQVGAVALGKSKPCRPRPARDACGGGRARAA
jgi:hypothetical protein